MNESGIRPLEFKVLVKPKKVEEKTEGGIYIPQDTKEKEQFQIKEGTLVAVSEMAFTEPRWLDPPKVGDRVIYERFAGFRLKGKDGELYLLMDDRQLGGVKYE